MASILIGISLVALWVALGEYILYNLIVLLAWLVRPVVRKEEITPPLTIIIPTHNEEKHIHRKLENILESDYPPELLDIVVVDDGSTDDTVRIVEEFENDGVRVLQTGERRGKIFAQKLAFSQQTAEIVAITDATVLAPPDSFRKLVAHMGDARIGAVSASMAVRNRDANYLTRVSQYLFDLQNAQKLGESRLDSAAGLFGQLSLVRREAVGEFSTDVVYEDREFGIVLRKRGYKARIEPGVVASYYAPESLADFSRQKQRNIGAMTQSVFRHSGMLFNPRYGLYGLLIFPEYSLFRILRPYLLACSFFVALIYSIFFDLHAMVPQLISMGVAVFGCYVVGTALLAPMAPRPIRFVLDIFATLPAMALVAAQMAAGSVKYFKGGASPKWDRISRDRNV